MAVGLTSKPRPGEDADAVLTRAGRGRVGIRSIRLAAAIVAAAHASRTSRLAAARSGSSTIRAPAWWAWSTVSRWRVSRAGSLAGVDLLARRPAHQTVGAGVLGRASFAASSRWADRIKPG